MSNPLALAKRLEGRLYVDEDMLHFVLMVDLENNVARVSRQAQEREVIEVALSEVMAHVSASTHLSLDNLNSQRSKKRVLEEDGEYFFSSREGRQGPYGSEEDAEKAMNSFIIASQKNRVPGERTQL